MTVINLFIKSVKCGNPVRQAEYDACARNWHALPCISRVIDIGGDPAVRPRYSDFWSAIRRESGSGDVNVVANADIEFDSSLELAGGIPAGVAYALSRWEPQAEGPPVFHRAEYSQDTWIFRGPPPENLGGDFELGRLACDWRVAYELSHTGYRVVNCGSQIRTLHRHASRVRNYTPELVPGPHAVVPVVDSLVPDPWPRAIRAYIVYPRDMPGIKSIVARILRERHENPAWLTRVYVERPADRLVVDKLLPGVPGVVTAAFGERAETPQELDSHGRSYGKRVVSFSLYGEKRCYYEGLAKNLDLLPRVYPLWVPRVYAEDSAGCRELLKPIADAHPELEVVYMPAPAGRWLGMWWRHLVSEDPGVERFLVRDCDSLVNPRESRAVSEWIADGAELHSLRDHPQHGVPAHGSRPVLGGLWGGDSRFVTRASGSQLFSREIKSIYAQEIPEYDNELYLRDTVVPLVGREGMLSHVGVGAPAIPGQRCLPLVVDLPSGRFVGGYDVRY